MKHRRILSGLAALVLAASLPMSALAKEWYLEDGDIIVSATESGQTVKQGSEDAVADNDVTITQRDIFMITDNTVTINAEKDQTAKVTLDGVDIRVSETGEAAISTSGEGNVTIELDRNNNLLSGENHAGIEKNNKGSLEIADQNEDGYLNVEGGENGAGIGGGADTAASDIIISGGEFQILGGKNAAGIGGGSNSDGSNITISGGRDVSTCGGENGAGIGGGSGSDGKNITISGGKFRSSGGKDSAAIGGGNGGDGFDITITGGYLRAAGALNGAAIGGGKDGDGFDITITGGNVEACGGSYGAGIGGGMGGDGRDITISGGKVMASSINNGAAIGGGCSGKAGKVTVSGDAQVKVQGGAEGPKYPGYEQFGEGACIGTGGSRNKNGKLIRGTEVTPNTSKLTANGKIEYYDQDTNMRYGDAFKTIVGTYDPTRQPSEQPKQEAEAPAQITAPLYRVTDGDGKDVKYETQWKDGVLTITTEADLAVLTGRLSGIAALQAQGIEKIVFITNGATSEFLTADLLAAGAATDTYALTHKGATVTFTLDEADVSGILG